MLAITILQYKINPYTYTYINTNDTQKNNHYPLHSMMEERKKRRNKGMSDMEIREYVENLIDKLEAAHEEDKQYLEEKKPAINRLAALSDFEQAVARPQLHRWLLDAGILAVFNHWLYPHSNGTLPNIRLRTSLLKMLTRLNIDTSLEHRRDQVKRSGVGKVVLFYAKLGDETAGNRKMAAALVERWTKPVYEQFGRRDRSQPPDEDAERMRELKRAQAAREEAAMAHFANPNAKPGDKGFRFVGGGGRRLEGVMHFVCMYILYICAFPGSSLLPHTHSHVPPPAHISPPTRIPPPHPYTLQLACPHPPSGSSGLHQTPPGGPTAGGNGSSTKSRACSTAS